MDSQDSTSTFAQIVPSIIAGFVAGVLAVIFMFSYAALIYTDDLSPFLSIGVGYMLFGAVVMSIIVALFSAFEGAIALPQDNPTAITAVISASIVSGLVVGNRPENIVLGLGGGTPETAFNTVVATIVLSTIISGLIFILIGQLKLGNIVKYIPYPVIGGFLAGTGWLLFKGSFSVMSGVGLDFANLAPLFSGDTLKLWLPGIIFGFALILILNRFSHFLVLPSIVISAIVVFYIILFTTGVSIDEAISQGWLLEPLGDGNLWKPLSPAFMSEVQWNDVFANISGIATIVIISVISLLLNLTALESAFRKDVNINKELRTVGFTNIFTALGGGMVGYHYVSLSTLGLRMGSRSRLAGLITAGVTAFALFLGASTLSYFPKFVLGGMVAFIGLGFLYDWVYQSWFKLSKVDFGIIVFIIAVIEFVGFLEGVGVGIIAAVVLFIISYSRITAIKHILSGAHYHSNFERPQAHRRVLHDKGDQTYILKLQGYVFFGTATKLLEEMQERLDRDDRNDVRYLIFDFEQVSGLDTSALHSFVKIRQTSHEKGFIVIYAHLPSEIQQIFAAETFTDGSPLVSHRYPTLDEALEWCENETLKEEGIDVTVDSHPIEAYFEQSLGKEAVQQFLTYVERLEVESGHTLTRQGEEPQHFFYVESGEITETVQLGTGDTYRLRTVGPGTLVGLSELMKLGDQVRISSAIASKPSTVYTLTLESLEKMKAEDNSLSQVFQSFIIEHMAEDVVRYKNQIQDILDEE